MAPRRTRSRVRPTLGIVLSAAMSPSLASAATAASSLPSIAAEHVRLHEPSDLELARVRIELSPDGLRLHAREDGADLEVVQDFAGERLWFVDRGRRVAYAPPMPPVSSDADVGDIDVPEGEAPGQGSFLGTEPCAGSPSRADGGGRWRGRAVDVWHCLDADGADGATELVDREHGIVVRRRAADGVVDELRDIRPVAFPPGHFVPSSRYRRVDGREMFLGAPSLDAFDESDDA